MAYTLLFVADLGANNTGLTIRGQLYNSDGSTNGAEITSGFVEVDSTNAPGAYAYNHTALPDAHRGVFVMYNNADKTQRVPFAVNPEEAEYTDSSIAGLNDISVVDITQRQIPDSYAADGTRPTIEQALLMIWQFLSERAVSGTTVTVKKPDGSTQAMSFTLSDGLNPTSITRAS